MEARHLLKAVRRHLAILILLPLVFGAAAWAVVATMEPTYSAVATVLVDGTEPGDRFDATGSPQPASDQASIDAYIRTQLGIIEGRTVREAAATALGDIDADSLDGHITAQQRMDTMLVDVAATASSAEDAKRIADAVMAAYVADRRGANVSSLQRALDEVARKAEEVRIAMTTPTTDGTPISDAEFRTLEQQFAQLSSRAQDIEIALNLQMETTEIISSAEVPDAPISPQPLRTAITAAVLGGLVAVGIAGLRQRLDRTVRAPEDVAALTSAPIIGSLPRDRARPAPDGLVVVDDPQGPFAEAIRDLRTSVQFAGVGRSWQAFVVTSGTRGDGKTTVATNLAAAFAACGNRALLISADLRGQLATSSHDTEESAYGLSDVIAAVHAASRSGEHIPQILRSEARKAIDDSRCPGLSVIHAGSTAPNPNELLSMDATRLLLEHLREEFETIVIDSPALGAVSDALVIARHADGVLLVAAAGHTDAVALERAVDAVERNGLHLTGVVMNQRSRAKRARLKRRRAKRRRGSIAPAEPKLDTPLADDDEGISATEDAAPSPADIVESSDTDDIDATAEESDSSSMATVSKANDPATA